MEKNYGDERMIDTDKYEGHTDGSGWIWEAFWDKELVKFGKTDRQLIADAPLLLAEVKRLREELEGIKNSMAWTVQVWWNENYMGREGWMGQMCEVYADLAKEIEAQYHGEEEE
jgi:hypothetical protein